MLSVFLITPTFLSTFNFSLALLVSILHLFLVVLQFFCLPVNIIKLLSQSNCFLHIRFNIVLSFSFDLFLYQTPAVASFVREGILFLFWGGGSMCWTLLMLNLELGLVIYFFNLF